MTSEILALIMFAATITVLIFGFPVALTLGGMAVLFAFLGDYLELFNSGTEWRIPIGLVPTTKEIVESPQHEAREFFEEVDHPVMGRITMPGAPFKMMDTPWQLKSPAPLLGEHNEEIYCQRLGYSREELVKLRERGVI